MGPSGSSKTTLLDVIAGRKTVGTISGKILFAGQKGTRTFLRRYTGYVEQFGERSLHPAHAGMHHPVHTAMQMLACSDSWAAEGPQERFGEGLSRAGGHVCTRRHTAGQPDGV